MKVTFLADKYKVGSNRGLYYHEKERFLDDLNFVIDIENSTYPEKWVETEDGKAYHKTKMTLDEFFKDRPERKLKPGDMFVYEGQVLAIDSPDRLIVAVSESGPLAAKRFIEDVLEAEVKMKKGDPEFGEGDLEMTELKELPFSDDVLDDIPVYCIPFYTEKVWRDKTEWPKNFKVKFSTSISFTPITLFVVGNKVYGDPKEIDSDMLETLTAEFMSRSWNKD